MVCASVYLKRERESGGLITYNSVAERAESRVYLGTGSLERRYDKSGNGTCQLAS